MSRYERIVHLPSLRVCAKSTEQIDTLLDGLAAERIDGMIGEQVRTMAQLPPGGQQMQVFMPGEMTREDWARRTFDTPQYRATLMRTHGAKYTYLSRHGNVEFLGENYSVDDIPPDLDMVLAEARGTGDRYVAIHVKARTLPLEINNPTVNRILIQSSVADRAWVNDLYARLSALVDSEKNMARDVVYRYMPLFTWSAFFSLVRLEYTVTHRVTGFDWMRPIDGLQLLFVFCALALSLILAFQVFYKVLQYAFPYFEFEGNLSRSRVALRSFVVAGLVALYGAAVVSLFL